MVDLLVPLLTELSRRGVHVTFDQSNTTESCYLRCRIAGKRNSHPVVLVRISDHDYNPKRQTPDFDLLFEEIRWNRLIAENVHSLLMSRWAAPRGRKPKSQKGPYELYKRRNKNLLRQSDFFSEEIDWEDPDCDDWVACCGPFLHLERIAQQRHD